MVTGIRFNHAAVKALNSIEKIRLEFDKEAGTLVVTPAAADDENGVTWASVWGVVKLRLYNTMSLPAVGGERQE